MILGCNACLGDVSGCFVALIHLLLEDVHVAVTTAVTVKNIPVGSVGEPTIDVDQPCNRPLSSTAHCKYQLSVFT